MNTKLLPKPGVYDGSLYVCHVYAGVLLTFLVVKTDQPYTNVYLVELKKLLVGSTNKKRTKKRRNKNSNQDLANLSSKQWKLHLGNKPQKI